MVATYGPVAPLEQTQKLCGQGHRTEGIREQVLREHGLQKRCCERVFRTPQCTFRGLVDGACHVAADSISPIAFVFLVDSMDDLGSQLSLPKRAVTIRERLTIFDDLDVMHPDLSQDAASL